MNAKRQVIAMYPCNVSTLTSSIKLAGVCLCVLLVGCQDDGSAELIKQLEDTNSEIRQAAVIELANYDGTHVVQAVASAVEDSDPDVRRLALRDLGYRGELAKDHLSLIESSLEHSHQGTSIAAALALHSLDPKRTSPFPILSQALLQDRTEVFLRVGEMGPEAEWALPTLIKLLKHKKRRIRALTVLTLARIGPTAKPAIEDLDRLLDDPEEAISEMAAMALDQIEAKPGKNRDMELMIPL